MRRLLLILVIAGLIPAFPLLTCPLRAAEMASRENAATPAVDGTLEFGIRPATQSGGAVASPEAKTETGIAGGGEPAAGSISLEIKEGAGGKKENGFYEEYSEEDGELADANKETPDPYENFNRAMFRFNDFLYENVMEPVSTLYSEVTDEDFRGIVRSFFYNVRMPARLVSSIIQGDGEKAGRVLSQFLINTLMTGGLVDVARTEFGIAPVEEDFDQALGARGVKTGPYFVWPLAGPSTARATVGGIIDGFLDPTWIITPGLGAGFGISAGKKVNETAINLDVKDEIDDMSIDPYLGVRDLYLQYRKGKVKE